MRIRFIYLFSSMLLILASIFGLMLKAPTEYCALLLSIAYAILYVTSKHEH